MMKKFLLPLLLFSLATLTQCKKTDAPVNSSLNKLSIGKSAHDLLSAEKYSVLNVEILYMPRNEPDAPALNNLYTFLNELLNKPGGINISTREIASAGKSTITLSEIKTIEDQNRTVFTQGNSIGICLLYLDARYTEANTLGLAYLNTSMAIFGPTMQINSGGVNQPSRTRLESIILNHEFGHNLGLVDLGSPMQVGHKDSNSSHCTSANCLMYYATLTSQLGGGVFTGPLPTLDNNCRNDLKANGGK